MKKIAMALLSAGLLISSGLHADEMAGGSEGSVWASGEMKKTAVIVGTVVGGLIVAGVANSNGRIVKAPIKPPVCESDEVLVGGVCVPVGPTDPVCEGDDPLVDGVCIGTNVTVTVSGTTTIYVPVTFTYLPTIPS
ncbi:hypothetical protein [Paraglaciecola hydrolytica]|uniref:Uncharacterized protein n=1 Tax=Paraglaciecola hydrolytica TaxID=1799789 RepID=A0A136A540_9ALTE|nr:hypothetical protein [Paraglaciecola hydrolytica]KXI30326.1 hypothetical protein AX660_10135 [Paraglaciecola hydrolytica]